MIGHHENNAEMATYARNSITWQREYSSIGDFQIKKCFLLAIRDFVIDEQNRSVRFASHKLISFRWVTFFIDIGTFYGFFCVKIDAPSVLSLPVGNFSFGRPVHYGHFTSYAINNYTFH